MQQLPKVLPLETLKTFHELGVEPPATNEDVSKTIAGTSLGMHLGSEWGAASVISSVLEHVCEGPPPTDVKPMDENPMASQYKGV